jgi:hypothetical protein
MEPVFRLHGEFDDIDGPSGDFPLSRMLEANKDDTEFCEWAKRAEIGEWFRETFGDPVERIS